MAKSKSASLVPLIILFLVVGVMAWVGYQMFVYSNELAERGKKKMEKKNITFTKDGMKVGVKEVKDEDYADKTQSVLVKAWNLTSFPAYRSRLWNTMAPEDNTGKSSGAKPKSSSSKR
ncbi:hypothetical protein K402DRAFT_395770 [Aulographum hederae CBS 113979]|uniref:Uncharacterized protein n=1 Tax=Aulographum hederae CBS 113979 TaxID=1176131 RepID=A0A6G1GTZ0_9PEZI|nr:hypothetical protein K402DRAFT_395770 [Aulographum hederae CBS 113979]